MSKRFVRTEVEAAKKQLHQQYPGYGVGITVDDKVGYGLVLIIQDPEIEPDDSYPDELNGFPVVVQVLSDVEFL